MPSDVFVKSADLSSTYTTHFWKLGLTAAKADQSRVQLAKVETRQGPRTLQTT